MYPQQIFLKTILVFWWQSDPAIIMHFLVKNHHIESWAKKYSTFYMIIIISGQWKRIHLVTKFLRCSRDSIIYEHSRARILHDYLLSASQSDLTYLLSELATALGLLPLLIKQLLPCDFLVSLPQKPTTADSTATSKHGKNGSWLWLLASNEELQLTADLPTHIQAL